jgi:hypothetical protein
MKVKRLFIAIALMLTVNVSRAQYSEYFYHRELDTVDGDWPTWFHQWWDWEEYRAEGKEATIVTNCHTSSCILGYNFSPDTLKVVGVAIIFPTDIYLESWYHPGKLYLYEAEADTFYKKGEVDWELEHYATHYRNLILHGNGNIADLNDPQGGCLVSYEDYTGTCCYVCQWDSTFRVMEYYFDEPVYVVDSFYVGKLCDFGAPVGMFDPGYMYGVGSLFYNNGLCKEEEPYCGFEDIHYKAMNDDSTWYYCPHYKMYELCWPIIQVDTTAPPEFECLPPENITVTPCGEGEAMVTWDGFGNYTSVWLRYGPVNMPPAQWTVVDVTGQNTYLLGGLNMAFPLYGMQLNASCDSLKRQSGWTAPVTFAPGAAVEGVETVLSEAVRLSPNPTGGKVEVESGLLLWHIDLYNGRGLLVQSERLSGHRSVIDMEGLPGGIYFAAIRTSRGTTVKKIVKQ